MFIDGLTEMRDCLIFPWNLHFLPLSGCEVNYIYLAHESKRPTFICDSLGPQTPKSTFA